MQSDNAHNILRAFIKNVVFLYIDSAAAAHHKIKKKTKGRSEPTNQPTNIPSNQQSNVIKYLIIYSWVNNVFCLIYTIYTFFVLFVWVAQQ